MRYSPKLLLLAALFSVLAPAAKAQDATAAFRFYSNALRDHMPSVEEAKEFYAASDKNAALDEFIARWLGEDAHEKRVARHFNDMFGVNPYFFLVDEAFDLRAFDPADADVAPPDLNEAGDYYLSKDVKATCGSISRNVPAWFTDGTISICSNSESMILQQNLGDADPNNDINCADAFGSGGIRNAVCGCGPEQILCYPRADKSKAVAGVVREWSDRSVKAYEDGWSWIDLIGGDTFYGDRWLYHHYLHTQRVAVLLTPPSAVELTFLKALPLDAKVEVTLPSTGVERAGVVTMPAFMNRFNNFRSRVRALSNEFLCKDVDGSLNTDGYAAFKNADLSTFDTDHGKKEGCATCHFGMDNQGSTLLGWSADGYYEAWDPKSMAGHVFGMDGSGPRFLMDSYATRADGFNECMAKKSWEGFTGASWDVLTAAEKMDLVSQATLGPRQAIRGVLTSAAMKKLRASPNTTVTKTVPVVLDFAKDVAPIIAQSCAGGACHSDGNGRPTSVYVGNEANFKNAPAIRISGGSMPPAGSGVTLSASDRNKLLIFLGQ